MVEAELNSSEAYTWESLIEPIRSWMSVSCCWEILTIEETDLLY